MNWQSFFVNNIEGYLLSDLREMNSISVEGNGNCGYPMLMTILSGIELLGGLVADDERWDRNKGREYFYYYYRNYLMRQYPEYRAAEKEIYSLIRNKLAHTFLTAMKFEVAKNSEISPITKNGDFIRIDVGLLFVDFSKSVANLRTSLENSPEIARKFETRLNEMLRFYGLSPSLSFMKEDNMFTTLSGIHLDMTSSSYASLATRAIPIDDFSNIQIVSARKKQKGQTE